MVSRTTLVSCAVTRRRKTDSSGVCDTYWTGTGVGTNWNLKVAMEDAIAMSVSLNKSKATLAPRKNDDIVANITISFCDEFILSGCDTARKV
jgi:hypothetical protein